MIRLPRIYLPSVSAVLNNLIKDSFLDIGQKDLLIDPGFVGHALDEVFLGRDFVSDLGLLTFNLNECSLLRIDGFND
jgi:hypothetical protein